MRRNDGESVLLVHHRDLSSPVGTTFCYYVADQLADAHDVDVVCRRRESERDEAASGQDATVHDIYTGEVPILSAVLFHLLSTLYVAALSIRRRYDVTYAAQSSLIQGWLGARLGGSTFAVGLQSVPVRQAEDFSDAAADVPLRVRLSIALLSLYAEVVGELLERAGTVVCLTEGILTVTERVYDVDLTDAHVVGMGVDVETFAAPANADAAAESAEDADRTITYIGAIHDTRNLEQVLEAMADLDEDITFRIAGQGPEEDRDALLETAERLGVRDSVEMLGLVPHDEVPALLASTDVAVSPLPDIESYRISFPAKLVEYMAAGSVVVATDIPPHRRLIEDGTNGYLYDGSRAGLVETLRRCFEADTDAVRRRAKETADRYDWDAVLEDCERALFEDADGPDATAVADD